MTLLAVLPAAVLLSSFLTMPVQAKPNADAEAVCNVLHTQYPEQVADGPLNLNNLTLSSDYLDARDEYWNAGNADIKPACIFFPGSADDISFAVKTLNKYPTAPWAVKGGGHNSNPGFSTTKDGVLIATHANMAYTTLDSDNLAHVGSGSRWLDIAEALDPHGRAVVGGRLGVVGAAGLTLGGGLSFLSSQYGLAADNVVAYNVVLADGTIAQASKSQNSDIWYALKGGGNQFAIVAEFIMQTYPIGQVWGGTKIYTEDKKNALLVATHSLISDYYDPKAAVINTFTTTVHGLVDVFVVFYFYDGPEMGDILKEFDAIPAILDGTKANQSYKDLLKANSIFSLPGLRYQIRTGTLPNLPGSQGVDLYTYTFDSWYTAAKDYQNKELLDIYIFNLAFQPVPVCIANASISNPNGVNLLGLDPRFGDKVFMEYDLSWLLPITDNDAASAITAITQPAQDYARSKYRGVAPTNYQSGDVDDTNYNPLFMNDGMYNQDVLRSYPSDVYATLAQIQQARDPSGFFSKRQGGFKFE